ncbi:S-layer homology domain-containing protein [Abyssisolibacter fermentans]|uniref:S-layer homology domain-containing protein n=1 Tax=Abyssisolibacter fermentans TaxID=1766203 RepID=UPI00082FC9DD|nr:S-layer homology domain-containing protein [Abyssisolibacter fermentans]
MFNRIRKNFSKLIAIIIITGISLINVGIADAATLQDIQSSSDYAKEAIIALAEKNIITGDEHGNFNPQNTVTRAEMITLIVRALEVDTTNVPDTPTFQDVPKTHWAYKYVETAYRDGIVKGMSEELFGKNGECTREQMTVMFIRSLGLSDEIINENEEFTYINELSDKDVISSWAKDAVEFSLASGLMKGTSDTTFTPNGNAQRQQVAVVTHRVINDKENILDFAKDNSKPVKHPNLYEALTNSKEYRGEFSINSLMNLNGTTPEETMTFAVTGNGAINGADSQMKLTMSISQPELTLSDLTFEMITIDNKLYIKEPGFDTWIEATPEDMQGATPLEMTPDELKQINEQFLNIYNKLPIENAGTEEIDGVTATKYILSLDNQAIKDTFPEEFLGQDMETDMPFGDAQLNLEIEFYLNEQNQIIKETLNFNGNFEEEEEIITFDMSMEVNYKNIGADIEITAPDIENIEVIPE